MSDLDDIPSQPNPPLPSPSNLILPPKFFLPSGERVETRSSQYVQDVGTFLVTNAVQSGRGEYYGPMSADRLVDFALEFRDGTEYKPVPFEEMFQNRRREFWGVQDVSLPWALCHPRWYSDKSQWMGPQPGSSSNRLKFPPPEIITSLVDAYFTYSNIYYPVLHRPTFQRLLDQKLHQRDHEFGSVLLVVCAIAARFSDHPYVSDVPLESPNSRMACWLSQTREVMQRPFTSTATLFEVQYYCVSRLFVRELDPRAQVNSPSFLAAWYMLERMARNDEVDHSWDRPGACQKCWGKYHKDIRRQTYNRG